MIEADAKSTPPSLRHGALHGIRVIDLTRMLSGPYCTMLLADHGADVIKIEPFEGDTSRGHGPYRDDDPEKAFGGYFQSVNRNKKSIALDLKSPSAKEVIRRLARTANVVVENFRPGVMERLGLGYDDLKAINPKIVYAAIRGFGDPRTGNSPYAEWPAYDVVAQAMGGIMGITGATPDAPLKVGPGVGDIFPGTLTALGISMALVHVERTGQGQFLDVAMYDAITALCERAVYQHTFTGAVPFPQGNEHPLFVPFGLFKCADGWVSIGCPNDGFWKILAGLIGHPDLASDERSSTKVARAQNRDFVNSIVRDWLASRTKAEVTAVLGGKIPFGPVNTAKDIVEDAHTRERNMLWPVEHPGSNVPSRVAGSPIHLEETPASLRHRAPYLSEHTDVLLSELGFSVHEVAEMRRNSNII